MLKSLRFLPLLLLILGCHFWLACSQVDGIDNSACENDTGEDCSVVINPDINTDSGSTTDTENNASCVAENDCDGDGVFTSCDSNDADVSDASVKVACDEDADGHVDLSCAAYDGARDINDDGKISSDERDVNCDVCVGEYDPAQSDANENGIGDVCEYTPTDTVETSDTDTATDTSDSNDGNTSTDTGETDDEEIATAENTDGDSDGLAASIDPDDSSFTSWGFINKDGGKQVCLVEQEGYEYIYVVGTKSAKNTSGMITPTTSLIRPILTQGIGLTGFSLGKYKNRRIKVEGVLDHSKATLDTIGYGGISCPTDLEYGIYMVIPDQASQ